MAHGGEARRDRLWDADVEASKVVALSGLGKLVSFQSLLLRFSPFIAARRTASPWFI